MGHGPAAYLGLAAPTALQVSRTSGETAVRQPLMNQKNRMLSEAVLGAATRAATQAGKDTAGVEAAWDRFGSAVESGSTRERKRAAPLEVHFARVSAARSIDAG
jgi:hypothetical protein